ncbi:MAG: hypothetical protein JWQ09_5417 [Segetibacter sp.]|nr:hypothetical protein [Segetibacter sp.]
MVSLDLKLPPATQCRWFISFPARLSWTVERFYKYGTFNGSNGSLLLVLRFQVAGLQWANN